jgi:hypothetical protein
MRYDINNPDRYYYAPKANKFTRNTALRKRKPRRSGAFLVKGNLPSCTDGSARYCCRGCPRSGCPSQTHPRRCPVCCGRSGCR